MTGADGERDHYRLLGVSRDATAGEIRRAYRRLARQHHPDLNPRPDGAARFAALANAYAILNDPAARVRYNRTLAGHVPSEASTANRDPRRSRQPADQPSTLRGTLDLTPHEAELLARLPLVFRDPSGQEITLPAGTGHGDEVALLYHGRAVLLTIRAQRRS